MERTTIVQRRLCYDRHQGGATYAQIAAQLGISPACVRYWYRQQRDGRTRLDTRVPRRAGTLLHHFIPLMRYVILRVRLQHPGWGRDRIQVALAQHPALKGKRLPSAVQIGRYLHQWPRFRRGPAPKRPTARPAPPQQVHQCWQLDFKVGIALTNQRRVNLYTLRDPVGAVCLAALIVAVPPGGITLAQTRQVLRQAFAIWHTLPDQVQTDHQTGFALTTQHDFPSLFTLWLVGLHIEHRLTRVGQPTDNAEVERCHRTLMEYAIRGNEHLAQDALQRTLDGAVQALNFDLASQAHGCQGRPPVIAHPEVLEPRHPFRPELELAAFDLLAVERYLAQFHWERTVSKVGQVDVGAHRYSVGRTWARHRIEIRFAPEDRTLVFSDDGTEIRRQPIKGLDVVTLLGLNDQRETPGPQQLCFSWGT